MENNDNLISDDFIKNILSEDAPCGDITSDFLPEKNVSVAIILCKENCILCGIEIVKKIFLFINKTIKFESFFNDGKKINKSDILCKISGNSRSLLIGERVSLNILSYLSGISTKTSEFVEIANKYEVKLLDTRKTLPLYRNLAKYAVRIGGGYNHRFSLSDMILIKDNHLVISNGIDKFMELVNTNRNTHPYAKIEIEVKNLSEAICAMKYKPDIVMLDNFTIDEAREAIQLLKDNVKIEISGNINLTTIEDYAKLRPDYISVGSITHSVKSIDFSMEFSPI
jgi:nicotinate-nucleotide pyrophosphorylase (carboxylating)